MPDNNDYLSQLLERVNQKLNDPESEKKPGGSPAPASGAPIQPTVFTSGGRFDSVPAPVQEEENVRKDEIPSFDFSGTDVPVRPVIPDEPKQEYAVTEDEEEVEEEDDDQDDYQDDHEEDLPQDTEKADQKTFSLSPDNESSFQPAEVQEGSENVFDWNVSEDVEKYLSSGDSGSIFEQMPENAGKKSLKAKRAEKRKLKENTRQLMDRNSGARRGCFGMFFHLIFLLIMVALTVLAVLYVLQTIADVTIIDVNSIISSVIAKISELLAKYF